MRLCIGVLLCALGVMCARASGQTLSGPLVKWQALTLDFAGPSASELGGMSNPFLDWRLNVTFIHPSSGKSYVVPGYFDGDGAGGGSGNVWRTRFAPDEPGQWTYTASFRAGANVAIDLDPAAGSADPLIDGKSGAFSVADRDPTAPGFLKWGRLEYDANGTATSKHYLKFRDGGYWIKGGADSPENLLGYRDFDNTPNYRHQYAGHVADWHSGDPTWGADLGKGLIGALNYLASRRVNSVYFLPMNIGGDGRDTWPFAGTIDRYGNPSNDNSHYDVSKLRQWETVFQHAERNGIELHFVLNEAEPNNKSELDYAELGVERKLFYRELIARFGHHNALQWNICEEYNLNLDLGESRVKQFAQYIRDVDPYDHPVTVHNASNPAVTWAPFFGDTRFDLTSLQFANVADGLGARVESLRQQSAAAGRPIPIMVDEPESIDDISFDQVRKRMLWDIYLSGGSVEWLIRQQDKSLEDFRPFEQVWRETWYARRFMEENLPFWEMTPADGLLSGETEVYDGGEVFAKPGEVYAVYLPDATSTGTLDLSDAAGEFFLRWYNPRTGQFEGTQTLLSGGGFAPLGAAPSSPSEDWTALVTAVPEPSTLGLVIPVSIVFCASRRRRFNKAC
jgi:hypothetical protein